MKQAVRWTLAGLILTAALHAPAAAARPDGLVGWWNGDGYGRNLADGTLDQVRPGTYVDWGVKGRALAFPGNDCGITAPDADAFKIGGSLSIEALVKVKSFPVNQLWGEILFRGDDRPGLDPYTLAVDPQGDVVFHVEGENNTSMDIKSPLPLNAFTRVLATLDVEKGEVFLYENSKLVAWAKTNVKPFRDLDPTQNPGIGIGNHGQFPTTPHHFPFDGLIQDVRLYNVAIQPATHIRPRLTVVG